MPSLPTLLSTALLLLAPLTNAMPNAPFQNRATSLNSTHNAAKAPKAIYFMTNDRTNNSIIALPVSKNGTLGVGTTTPTGGVGGNHVLNGTLLIPDALGSQNSMRLAGNLLFAVNAGSNTLSLFTIEPNNPLHLTPLGPPVPTRGDFPNTIAVSLTYSLVCVGSIGAVAGIACAPFSAQRGVGQFDALRPLNLNQTTPPTGPLNEIGDVLFNEGDTKLFVTVRENPAIGRKNFISVFPVVNGVVSTTETRTSPPRTRDIFGSVVIPGTNSLLTSDLVMGAVRLDISALDNTATTSASSTITGQVATCWAAISSTTGTGFITDADLNRLVEVDLTNLSTILELRPRNGNFGMADVQAVGDNMYALSAITTSGSAAVAVFDVSGGRGSAEIIQNFVVAGVGPNAMGMVVLE